MSHAETLDTPDGWRAAVHIIKLQTRACLGKLASDVESFFDDATPTELTSWAKRIAVAGSWARPEQIFQERFLRRRRKQLKQQLIQRYGNADHLVYHAT